MPSDSANPELHQFIIGLIGDSQNKQYVKEIKTQISLTHSMMQNKKAKIPGLEEVPVDRKSSFTQFVLDNELRLKEIPTAQRASQDRKSTDVKEETVVLHICGHHEPKEKKSQTNGFGFRTAHKDGFYKPEEITSALASFLNTFPDLQDLHIVLHSCETAKSTATSTNPDEAFNGSTMLDIISSLKKSQLQQESMAISIYGVEQEISQSRHGYELWDSVVKTNKITERTRRTKVTNSGFKKISATLTKQEEDELPADLPSTPEKSSEAGDQGDSPSSRVKSPTTTESRFEKNK